MKVKILVRPTGLLNTQPWPEVGEVIDLPDHVAEGMAAAGDVEIVKAPKKAAEKVEKRPAAKKAVETR